MREILFRGKCADNYKNSGKWAEGYLLRFTEKRNPFIMLKDGGGECVEVIPESIGQYTGLTDKNGGKIFEGDIIERGGRIWRVKYGDNYGKVMMTTYTE